ncbi:unnamed protein product [Rotaria sp. Silwood2]|nr:unnamed protein product [Rotaria sp. Silwood2]CAF2766422.1 unnamed protein product [Rotaria sp. Silwood2]CAF2943028.1 unnamed protein product [Rotaria sp. Silwood2]CAF4372949.1 unnamed protein product [Rotaria sp. Silwood2]CAF4480829.1 unnamed protein product [Rotaria sp. Silwood2]
MLDVYYSTKDSLRDVLIFVHGGKWKSDHKNRYNFLGRNFVREGLVTVIINYSLLPNQIDRIAQDCAAAVIWVHQNISNYGGNPDRIFLMGHSSGGHLIEFINCNSRFFIQHNMTNPIHGIILLDAFGLDMHEYLNQASSKNSKHYNTFIEVFSNNPEKWSEASPMKYWKNIRNPHLILIGERTYPSIQAQNRHLFGNLIASKKAPAEFYEIPHRHHTEMIIYMLFHKSQQYNIILNFMRRN